MTDTVRLQQCHESSPCSQTRTLASRVLSQTQTLHSAADETDLQLFNERLRLTLCLESCLTQRFADPKVEVKAQVKNMLLQGCSGFHVVVGCMSRFRECTRWGWSKATRSHHLHHAKHDGSLSVCCAGIDKFRGMVQVSLVKNRRTNQRKYTA